jgi:OPA family glycerol-3-phosphate transporter-like MFS transporter
MRDRAPFVLFTLVVGYGAFYLCRANVESSFPLLAADFGFTKVQLGTLSSIPIATYAVGKVVMGTFGDVIGGKRLMLVATSGSVLATFAFGASSGLAAFVFFAAVNRFFQSGGWSGAVSIVALRFEPPRHGLVMGILSTSYELGNVLAILLCSAVTRWLPGWRPLFRINPTLFAIVGIFLAVMLRPTPRLPRSHASPALPASVPPEPRKADEPTVRELVAALARKPAFWIAVVLSVLLTFLRVGFLTWTPTYLYELSRATGKGVVSAAIAKSAIFSSAGVVAALTVGALSDRFGPGRRAPVMAASLAMVVALVVVLAHGQVRSPLVAALLIGGVGLFLLGPYSLLAGALALDVSAKRGAATAAGIIDGAGYLGASLAGIVLGGVAEKWGWSAAFDVVAAAAFMATLVTGAWAVRVLRTVK